MKQNMTAGPPARLIFFFTLPLLAGNLFQQLYNMVDSVVVGRFVGPTALAAVGSAFPMVFLLSSLFLGLGQGAMVLVSQFYGASDEKRLKAAVDTIYTALIVGGIPLSVLGCLCVGPITGMMAIAPDALAEFRIYLLIMLGGLVGSLGYNANSGILQGLGDSKTPVLFLVVACGINIALDLLFVVVFHWGVAGVAVATIIAQAGSWVFGILFINCRHPTLHISPFCFRFDKAIFAQVIRIGVPIGIQQALFSLGAMLLVRLVNSFGSDFTAGYNAANKVDTIAFLPVQSFSMAVTTFVGQNMGAGKPERVRQGSRAALWMGTAVCMGVALALLAMGPWCMRLFSADAAVIDAGLAYLYRVLPFYFLFSLMYVLNGIMRGAGETLVPLASSLVSLWLARVPVAYALAHFFGGPALNFCFPIGWAVGLAISLPYYLSGRWKRHRLV